MCSSFMEHGNDSNVRELRQIHSEQYAGKKDIAQHGCFFKSFPSRLIHTYQQQSCHRQGNQQLTVI